MRREIADGWRSVLLCALAAFAVCCALALSPAHAAAFGWSQGTEVALPIHTQGDLYGVSCPASGSCVASGAFENANEEILPLVAFQSSGWGASELPLPSGATSKEFSGLQAISCPETGYCVAVGTLENGVGAKSTEALISTYADGSWTSEALPAPDAEGDPPAASSEAKTELTGVSCATPGSCVAVGSYEDQSNSEVAFIATQAAGKWTTEVLETPAEMTGGQLAAISCPSASSCEAVGSYKSLASATEVNPMVATNEGGTWASGTITLPAGVGTNANALLSGVSCAAAGECVADGAVEEGTSGEALVVTLDHGSSSTSAVPSPSAGAETAFKLYGVSCPLSSFCAAAGELQSEVDGNQAIGATLTASGAVTTTILETPANALRQPPRYAVGLATLAGVSCWEADGCVGAGSYVPTGGGQEPMVVSYGEQPASTPPPSPTRPPSTSQTPSMPQATPLPMTTAAVPVIALKSKKITLAKGKAKVKLACSGAACAGKVKLEVSEAKAKTAKKGKHGHGKKAKGAKAKKGHKLVVVAQASYKLAAGKSETLKLKLTAKGKKALAKASRKHPVTVTILVTVKGGKQLKRTVEVI